jgi:TrmH family RNA methyltransferase
MKPLSKALLKRYASLHLKKYRQKYGLFVGEGRKILQEGLKGKRYAIESIVITLEQKAWLQDQKIPSTIPIYYCNRSVFDRLSTVEQGEGVITIFRVPKEPPSFPERALILFHLMDPGNVGTLLRTAYSLGMPNCVLVKPCVDPFNPKVIRASMGALLHMNLLELSEEAIVPFLREGNHVAIAHMTGKPISAIDFRQVRYLILGNESQGVHSLLPFIKACQWFSIPQKADFDSLNVSVAGAISLYEWLIRSSNP